MNPKGQTLWIEYMLREIEFKIKARNSFPDRYDPTWWLFDQRADDLCIALEHFYFLDDLYPDENILIFNDKQEGKL